MNLILINELYKVKICYYYGNLKRNLKNMNIIIFISGGHPQANLVLKRFLEQNSKHVSAIFESTRLLPKKSNPEALYQYFKVAGFWYVFPQIVKRLKFRIFTKFFDTLRLDYPTSEHFSYKRISPKVPVIPVWDVNDPRIIGRIKKYKPDLFISIFFNQIFKTDILKIPNLGVVNFHPAYLPTYRGVSPTFWVLANQEKETGVTLHTIDDTEIDAGRIISQRKIKILPSDSETSLYRRCVLAGIEMLQEMMDDLQHNKNFFDSLPKGKVKSGSYYSIPKKDAVEKFLKLGRKF